MGFFKDLELDVLEMYTEDGMKEHEIAKSLGVSLTQVNEILAKYDAGDFDYDITDTDADDGQPSEYEEWQDYMGGDDSDNGQYDVEY